MVPFPVACVGALASLQFMMAFSMSMMRVNNVKGFGDKRSWVEKWHTAQLLTSEYVPTFCVLILYIHFHCLFHSIEVGSLTQMVMGLAVVSRYMIPLRTLTPKGTYMLVSVSSNAGSYIAFLALILCALSYSV